MTHDEMRMIRRDYINGWIQTGFKRLSVIKFYVRFDEKMRFGTELKAYV